MSRSRNMPKKVDWRPFDIRQRICKMSSDVRIHANKLDGTCSQQSTSSKRKRPHEDVSSKDSAEFLYMVAKQLDALDADVVSCLEEIAINLRDSYKARLRTTPLEFECISECAAAPTQPQTQTDADNADERPVKKRRRKKNTTASET